jgi:hypothetical protein
MVSLFVLTLVSASTARADSCPNAAFRTGASANLPDCRAYELVTASFTGGLPGAHDAFLDGSNVMLASLGAFGNPGDSVGATGADYRVLRSTSSWSATPVEPPASQFENDGTFATRLQDVSQDFAKALFNEVPTSSKAIDRRLYIRQPDGSFAEVGPMVPPTTVASWTPTRGDVPEAYYQGASRDLLHVFFGSTVGNRPTNFLWPGDTTLSGESLYEYVGTGNSVPRLVGVDDAGHLISQCGTGLGHVENGSSTDSAFNAISADGSVVFFTSVAASVVCGGSGPPVDELFARIDGAHTVAISEPSPNNGCTSSACLSAPLSGGRFEGASADGSKVFFTSTQQLLDQASEDNTGGDGADNQAGAKGCAFTEGPNGCNLYEYDFANPAGNNLVLLSGGDSSGKGPQVQGVSRISQDGSHVYFVAKGVLTTAPSAQGHTAQAGADNLYVYEPDPATPGQSKTVFIATLSAEDREDWGASDTRSVDATPDGRFLLFPSTNDLTADASGGGSQFYRYDAQTGELVRVSIGESGFNNNGNTGDSYSIPFSSYVAGGNSVLLAGPQPTAISDNGEYVFFQSPAGLTPQALNDAPTAGGSLAVNVYEYHEGHVYLISDGRDRHEQFFSSTTGLTGTNSTGSDVFFTTADQLLPQDTNTQLDFYDARIHGGLPAPTIPAPCAGEGCRGASGSSPVFGAPASSTFSGVGNLSPTPTTTAKARTAAQIKAEKLAKALKACRAKHNKHQRAICEAQARKKYGPTHKAKKTNRRIKRSCELAS